jgi:hypothetical protein
MQKVIRGVMRDPVVKVKNTAKNRILICLMLKTNLFSQEFI